MIELSLFFENGRDLNNLELRYSDQTVMNDSYLLDSIQGMRAVCLPEPIDKKGQHHSFFSWQDCRNWGMIGLNGKWLIEPKFDEPFHFENGIADVRYYGQKRKINEKGEFVE